MPADGLTKALSRQKHQNFVRQLGLVDLSKLGLLGADREPVKELKTESLFDSSSTVKSTEQGDEAQASAVSLPKPST